VEGPRKAVLVGDVIFSSAIAMMSETSREDGLAAARAIALVSAGALHEPLAPGDLATLMGHGTGRNGLYERIIHLKTGVLFGAACELGAIAASAPEEVRDAARRYGLLTGEAYQIADDLKEVNAYVSQGSARPEQVVAIAPALLHFAEGSGPRILRLLEEGGMEKSNALLDLMIAAQKPMEEEIGSRLRSAASEIEGCFPTDAAGRLAREAPWGAISLFNEP
jgi:geranylgeranyl pyrophosphate synthase